MSTPPRASILVIIAIVVVIWLVYLVWNSPDATDYMQGIITLVLGRFIGYLDAVYNYEFGTTRSSKEKDATITTLSEKQ